MLGGGDSSRPAVLALHGVGLDWRSWTPLLEAARRRGSPERRRVLVDLLGFGASAPLTRPVSLDDVSGALVDVLDCLGLSKVDVLGHSMGGFAALHLASAWPGRVRTLVCVSGSYAAIVDIVNSPLSSALREPRTRVTYRSLAFVAAGGCFIRRLVRAAPVTGLLRLGLWGFAARPLQVRRSLLSSLAPGGQPDAFRYAQATARGYDCSSWWSAVKVPTLAVFGARDALVTKGDAGMLTSALPSVASHVLEESAHLAPLEQPVELLLVLDRWWHGIHCE